MLQCGQLVKDFKIDSANDVVELTLYCPHERLKASFKRPLADVALLETDAEEFMNMLAMGGHDEH